MEICSIGFIVVMFSRLLMKCLLCSFSVYFYSRGCDCLNSCVMLMVVCMFDSVLCVLFLCILLVLVRCLSLNDVVLFLCSGYWMFLGCIVCIRCSMFSRF